MSSLYPADRLAGRIIRRWLIIGGTEQGCVAMTEKSVHTHAGFAFSRVRRKDGILAPVTDINLVCSAQFSSLRQLSYRTTIRQEPRQA